MYIFNQKKKKDIYKKKIPLVVHIFQTYRQNLMLSFKKKKKLTKISEILE